VSWFKRHKVLSAVGVLVILFFVVGAVGSSQSPESTKQAAKTVASAPKSDAVAAAKKVADDIVVESAGIGGSKEQHRYGFIVTNNGKQAFTGEVTIILTNFEGVS